MSDENAAPVNVASASVVKFAAGTPVAQGNGPKPRGLNVVPSFSVLSSGITTTFEAEKLIIKGARKKPVGAQSIEAFYRTVTHLFFASQKLVDDVAAITLCSNLRVLYVYDNRLTTLRGLGGLQKLTHLYAQDNRIESLHDFECPPNLEQLHIGGNRLTVIGGLETCVALQELHLGQQKAPSSRASSPEEGELTELEPDDADGNKHQRAAALPPGDVLPPLSFEPASLYAIAPTLLKLVVCNARLDDDALEPIVVLQSLASLDLRANLLQSIARLQQLLLRLPYLESIHLSGNPLCDAPKTRERLIVAAPRLGEIDGKAIKQNERAFLQSLAARQSATSGKASPTDDESYDLGPRAGLLLGEPPAGFYEDTHQPVSLCLGNGSRRPWARSPAFN